jgi:hypothetical protein
MKLIRYQNIFWFLLIIQLVTIVFYLLNN